MPAKSESRLPTNRPESLKSFVDGREQYYAYLSSGRIGELKAADRLFAEAAAGDPRFDLAVFYHALTLAQLRKADAAIEKLQCLVDRDVEFLAEVYLHKAYAHIKKYRNEHFSQAETALESALQQAERRRQKTLTAAIEVYQVFLWAVMGGNLKEPREAEKSTYIAKAIRLGENILWELRLQSRRSGSTKREAEPLLHELLNALGIAYMRKGEQQGEKFSEAQKRDWQQAKDFFREALELELNPVRVLQNMGTLLSIQGHQLREAGQWGAAETDYREAVKYYEESTAINPHDQFPHSSLAELFIRLGDWERALHHVNVGRLQPGSFDKERKKRWDHLRLVIAKENPALLDSRPDARPSDAAASESDPAERRRPREAE